MLALEHGCTFLRPDRRRQPAGPPRGPRLGEDLPRPVPLRLDASTGSARPTTPTPAASAPTCATASSSARGATYDYQNYGDLYGNKATNNWNPRQCAKGYTFHRVLYGPYRLRHPIVRKGWKAWADAGFPELTPELKAKYKFDRRGEDEFVQFTWEDAFANIARALDAIARRYSGEEGAKRLLAQGYQPEMVEGHGRRRHAHDQDARRAWACWACSASTACTGSTTPSRSSTRRSAASRPEQAKAGRNCSNYTWHGDQAPGQPWVHGLQASDCDFNDLRFSKLIIMDGKNLVENKLTDSHWFIETHGAGRQDRGHRPRVRPALHQGRLLDPDPAPDRRRALPRHHAAHDGEEAVRPRVREVVHRLPAPRPHGHPEAPAGPRGVPGLQEPALRRTARR